MKKGKAVENEESGLHCLTLAEWWRCKYDDI